MGELRKQMQVSKLKWLEENNAPEYEIIKYKADMLESKATDATSEDGYKKNKEEIEILKRLLDELYVMIGRQIQAEIIANGRPSPAKIGNAMSNPHTWNALKQIGLIPEETKILEGNVDPKEKIKLIGVEDEPL